MVERLDRRKLPRHALHTLSLGMTRKCLGPCGAISRNAKQRSSSCMMSALMDLSTILSKKVGAFGLIAGSVEAASAAAVTSLIVRILLENNDGAEYLKADRETKIPHLASMKSGIKRWVSCRHAAPPLAPHLGFSIVLQWKG